MKELVVISGKGGTGKTSIVASFSAIAVRSVLADCDVDAADLHLILEPKIEHREDFSGGKRAKILTEKCTNCGICYDVCRFNAVKKISENGKSNNEKYFIDSISCEGCGVCVRACPNDAITFNPVVNGELYISTTRNGPMAHAKLGIAEENSGKLVTLVRNQAKKLAEEKRLNLIIVDGPPGIGCPVIASIAGADLVLVVIEPTLSGYHDLDRVLQLTKHFRIPTVVCINKWDLNPRISELIESNAHFRNTKVIGKIRYDNTVTKAQIMKSSVVEYTGGAIAQDIKNLWRHVIYELG